MAASDFVKGNKNLSLMAIALVLGLIATGLALLYLKNREEALRLQYQKKPEKMIAVIVPKRDLYPGEQITTETAARRPIPATYVSPDVITAANFRQYAGRRLQLPAQRGKPIPLASLSGLSLEDFSDLVKKGRRAVTIKVDRVNSFDGMLRPGNHIDLMVAMAVDEALLPLTEGLDQAGAEEAIFPLLENVVVLATGDNDIGELTSPRAGVVATDQDFTSITLDLYPEQVAMIKSADQVGYLIAALRNREDDGTSGFDVVRPSSLYDLMQKVRVAASARASKLVAVDANGNVLGKIVGDTVYDEQGNVVGRVDENGDILDVSGQVIGRKQMAQVALGNDGKPIGTIVGDKVYDDSGNVIGRVDESGRIVSTDGDIIGNASSAVAVDSSGNVIGNVVDGVVYDNNGNVVGRVDASGNVVDNTGRRIGSTSGKVAVGRDGKAIGKIVGNKVVDENGNVIAHVAADGSIVDLDGQVIGESRDNVTVADVALDENGNVIGRIDQSGNVIDEFGNVVGRVSADGSVIGNDGKLIGSVAEDVLLDSSGNLVASEMLDADGNVIGKVIGGKVYDDKGQVIGRVDDQGRMVPIEKAGKAGKLSTTAVGDDGRVLGTIIDGKVYSETGELIGTVDEAGNVVDLDGNVIGSEKQGELAIDANGNVLGVIRDGVVYDDSGNAIGTVDADGVITDNAGNTLGYSQDAELAIDADGKVLGVIKDGAVIDADGNVVGSVAADGTVTNADGEVIGKAKVGAANLAVDADGNVLGTIRDGKVYDESGNLVGTVDETGAIRDADGKVVGYSADAALALDDDGNVIGVIKDGLVIDGEGNVVGTVDAEGNVLVEGDPVEVSLRAGTAEPPRSADAAVTGFPADDATVDLDIYESISGGNSTNGVLELELLPLEAYEEVN